MGVSLSELEASVAAPFTSSISNISCVPALIKEGRCALTTSFGVFKYMALYSFIQFFSVLILYTERTNLGDTQFLYIDLVITTTVAVLMGRTGPWHSLVRARPPGSLVSGATLMSVGLQILASLGGQLTAVEYLQAQPWSNQSSWDQNVSEIFSEHTEADTGESEENVVNFLTTVVFTVSSYQYLSVAAVFSRGPPYRKPFYTNILFFLAITSLGAFTTLLYLNFEPLHFLTEFFQLSVPDNWRFTVVIFGIIGVNMLVNCLIEMILHTGTWVKTLSHFLSRKKQPKNKYKIIQRQLDLLPDVFTQSDGS